LPLAGFAQINEQQLHQTNEQLWQAWQGVIASFPTRLAALPLALTLNKTHLTGQIDLLYVNEKDNLCHLVLLPGLLKKQKDIKAYKLLEPWLIHCLAHALNHSMITRVIAADAQISFHPLEANQARLWLQNYVALYQQAWHQPLKVACKSGLAFVQSLQQQQSHPKHAELSPERQQDIALKAARSEFEGGFGRTGEWNQSLELQRCFEDFDELQPEFISLAQQLYGEMLARIEGE
jgi:exonuclease V gamma subunit